jgi:hypothetical protein
LLARALTEPTKQKAIDFVIYEVGVPLQVLLVDVQARGNTEETLELRDAHYGHEGSL